MSEQEQKKERRYHVVFEGKTIDHRHIIQICIQNGVEPKVGDTYIALLQLLQDKGVDIQAVYHD